MMSSGDPTRLELFCAFADRNRRVALNDVPMFLSDFDSVAKGVVAEMSLISRDGAPELVGGYTALLAEAATAVGNTMLASLPRTCGDGATTATAVTAQIKALRTCASVITSANRLRAVDPSSSSSTTAAHEAAVTTLLLAAQDADTWLRQTQHLAPAFAACQLLQRAAARCSVGAAEETWRVPVELFDSRKAFEQVQGVLASKSKGGSAKAASLDSVPHIACLAPLYDIGGASLQQHLSDLVAPLLAESQHAGRNPARGDGIDDDALQSHGHLVVPRVAAALKQILSDVTNLLSRAAAQTPKNSPSVAFLAFLVCDVASTLGHQFCPALVAACAAEDGDEEDGAGGATPTDILFSRAFFPVASLAGGAGDLSTVCTKLDVALGCALDCLLGDIESAVAGACGRFENPTPEDLELERKAAAAETAPPNKQQGGSTTSPPPPAVVSLAMMHVLVNVAQPLLAATQCFSAASTSAVRSEEATLLATAARKRIVVAFAKAEAARLQAQAARAKRDLRVLFEFLQRHPFMDDACAQGIEMFRA